MSDSKFIYAAKISGLKFQPNNDMAFHVRSYEIKNALAAFFGVPARFTTEHYLISHGKKADGSYYFDVYFADRTQAMIFKLTY